MRHILAVSDFICKCGFLNGSYDFFLPFFRRYDDFEFDLRLKENINFRSADNLFVSALYSAAHYLGYCDAIDLYFIESVFYFLEFLFSDDCFYFD